MADRLKNRIRFSTTLNQSTLDMIKEYSSVTMIPVSKLVDAAIVEYLKKAGESFTLPPSITYSASDSSIAE